MGTPDIVDPEAQQQRPLWDTCGPGVYRNHARQRRQRLDIKDEHVIDPGRIEKLFYIMASANWDKTKDELGDTDLCTLAMLGLREIKDAIEQPIARLGSGGTTAFRRAHQRLNVVLEEVARRKQLVEDEIGQRSRGLSAPTDASGDSKDGGGSVDDEGD